MVQRISISIFENNGTWDHGHKLGELKAWEKERKILYPDLAKFHSSSIP